MLLTIYGDERCATEELITLASTNITSSTAAPSLPLNVNDIVADLMTTTAATTTALPAQVARYISMVLYQFELDEDQSAVYTRAITWLLIHLIGWRLLCYFCLWWKVSAAATTTIMSLRSTTNPCLDVRS